MNRKSKEVYKLKTIGQKLVELRGKMTQEELATKLEISNTAISMYENDKRIPRDEVKKKYADFFNVTVQELFFD